MKKFSLISLLTLIISGNVAAQSFAINTTGTNADASAILDVSSTSKGILIPRMTTAQRTAIASPATGLVVYDNSLNQFYYYNGTAWTAIATVTATNYWTLSGSNLYNNSGTFVGVGLTSPSANLDVTGTNTSSNSLQLRSGNTGGSTSSNQVVFSYNNTTNYRHAIKTRHNSGAASGNTIDFYVWNFGTDAVGTIGTKQVMTLDGNGNVGIGTTAPTTALDVSGKTRTTTFQLTTGATNSYVLQSDASGNGSWVNASTLSITETDPQVSSSVANYIPKWNGTTLTDGIVYDNGTNVAIGTTTPLGRLHVQNSGFLQALFTSTAGASNIITASVSGAEAANYYSTYSAGAASKRWAYGKNDDSETGSNAGSDFFINRYDDNGNYLDRVMNVKRSNGYVAIGGNFNAQKRLHVSGGTRTDNIQITTGASNGYVLQSDASGNASWVSATTLGTTNYWTSSNGNIYNNTGTNVGIGTSSPGNKLQVDVSAGNYSVTDFGVANGVTVLGQYSGTSAGAQLRFLGTGAGFIDIGQNNTGDFIIEYADAPKLIVTTTGNIGIGTATPASTLSINGSMAAAVTTTPGSLTLDGSNYCVVYTGSTGNTFTLPAANTCAGRMYLIINHGTDVLTTSNYRTGNTTTATTIAVDNSIKIISDGSEWRLIN